MSVQIAKSTSFVQFNTGTLDVSADAGEVYIAAYVRRQADGDPSVFSFTVDETFELVDALHDAIEEAMRGDATDE